MPALAKELSAVEVKRLRRTTAVGGVRGLTLACAETGARSWLLRFSTATGERRDIGLGSYPEVSLAEARERARALRAAARDGRDPLAERRAARAEAAAARAALKAEQDRLTFAAAAEIALPTLTSKTKNPKARAQWGATLKTYAYPVLGPLPVAAITTEDVRKVLEPIWTTKAETAARLRGRIEAVLDWAVVARHRPEGPNPARLKGHIALLLGSQGKRVAHQPAVAQGDACAWFAALRQRDGMAARALEFLTLCASRTGEVRGAMWEEIDLGERLWRIPAERMKMGRAHIVPLSGAAVAVLEALEPNPARRRGVIFKGPSGKALSDMALLAAMRRMHAAELAAGRVGWLDGETGQPAVPHGLRATFRTWAGDRDDDDWDKAAEASIAHASSRDPMGYNRGTKLARRRALMQDWADFLTGGEGNA